MTDITFSLEQINLVFLLIGVFSGIFLSLCAYVIFCLCDLISEKVRILREKEKK